MAGVEQRGAEQKPGGFKGTASTGLEWWNRWNKVTLTAEIGVALFVPALAVPALALATLDVGQIYINNKIKDRLKKNNKETVVFERAKTSALNHPPKEKLALAA